MKRLVPILCFCCCCELTLASSEAVFATIPEEMAKAKVPGLAIAFIEDGRIVRQQAFGTRRLGSGEPLSLDSVFEAASIGKVVAAYRLFSLIETGAIALEDTITHERLITDCGNPTIGEILSHTAGFGNDIRSEAHVIDCERVGAFSYGGEGFVVLESAFEQTSGAPSETDILQSVFVPLGMESSSMGSSPVNLVTGHPDLLFALLSGRAGVLDKPIIWLTITGMLLIYVLVIAWSVIHFRPFVATGLAIALLLLNVVGLAGFATTKPVAIASENRSNDIASSLKTTATDLASFAIELMAPTLVSESTRDLMFTPVTTLNHRTAWGYGIGIDRSDGVTTYWHWGSNPGYQSLMVIEPGTQRGVVVLTNGGGFADFLIEGRGGYDLARALAARILEIDGHWMITEPE